MAEVDLNKLRITRDAAAPAIKPRRRFRVTWWMWLVVIAAIAGGWFYKNPPAIAVETTQVVLAYPSQEFVELNATGYVVARRQAAVASKATGRVEWLGVTEGSVVRAGDIIARLESRDVDARLANAVANTGVALAGVETAKVELRNAEAQFERTRTLTEQRFLSAAALDDARARVERARAAVVSAQASVTAARANENFAKNEVEATRIVAPFDGVVISAAANVGDVVTPLSSAADAKGAVAQVADMSTLEIDADVSESALGKIRLNQPCEIVFDAFPDKRYSGVVATIVPTVNRASATVTTKVRILDSDAAILPDMSAKVKFLSQAIDRAADIPTLAADPQTVVTRNGRNVVYRVGDDGLAHEIAVKPGAMLGDLRAFDALAVRRDDGSASVADIAGLTSPDTRPLDLDIDRELGRERGAKPARVQRAVARGGDDLALRVSDTLDASASNAAAPAAVARLATPAGGLKAGDVLIVNPGDKIRDKVRVKPAK